MIWDCRVLPVTIRSAATYRTMRYFTMAYAITISALSVAANICFDDDVAITAMPSEIYRR